MPVKDKAGLALALESQTLMDGIVKAMRADKQLPETLILKPTQSVRNPFA